MPKLKDVLNENKLLTNKKIEHTRVPLELLDAMSSYQREIDMTFVEEKIRDDVFDESEVQEIKVSVRPDGSYKVCDGQHTVAILSKRGYTHAKCELRYGLTEQEENDWFFITNTKTRQQYSKRLLTSSINGTYEKNQETQDFYNCLKAIGFKLDLYGETPGELFKIKCSSRLLDVYKSYHKNGNDNLFIECMDIIKTCFNGDPISLQWNFIKGMFDFYNAYHGNFETKRLIDVLSRETVSNIKNEAEADIRTKKSSMKYTKLFVEKYNFKLPKKKQLKMGVLDDLY